MLNHLRPLYQEAAKYLGIGNTNFEELYIEYAANHML